MKRIVTTKEAAQLLGVCPQKFLTMRRTGAFPIKPVPYCHTRYDRNAIESYLDSLSKETDVPEDEKLNQLILSRLKQNGKNRCEVSRH